MPVMLPLLLLLLLLFFCPNSVTTATGLLSSELGVLSSSILSPEKNLFGKSVCHFVPDDSVSSEVMHNKCFSLNCQQVETNTPSGHYESSDHKTYMIFSVIANRMCIAHFMQSHSILDRNGNLQTEHCCLLISFAATM